MRLICYLRRDTVFIPTMAKVDVGGYLDVDPVAVVPIADAEGLRRSFLEVAARGNPPIESPTRANHPPPVVLKHAGVKTWSAFARGTRPWQLEERDCRYRIVGLKDSPGGGWEEDPQQVVEFAPGTEVEVVIDRLIGILQAASKKEPA